MFEAQVKGKGMGKGRGKGRGQDLISGCAPLTPTPAGLLEGMNSVVAPVLDEFTVCR